MTRGDGAVCTAGPIHHGRVIGHRCDVGDVRRFPADHCLETADEALGFGTIPENLSADQRHRRVLEAVVGTEIQAAGEFVGPVWRPPLPRVDQA
jgi:hypothetical protein